MKKKYPNKKGIIFVDDDSNVIIEQPATTPHPNRWKWIVGIGIIAAILLCGMTYGGRRFYNYYYNIGVPISVTPQENIAKLAKPYPKGAKPEVVLTSDSILGVALNMYELKNLQAEITLTEPDSTDTSAWLYSRCADHTSDGKYRVTCKSVWIKHRFS